MAKKKTLRLPDNMTDEAMARRMMKKHGLHDWKLSIENTRNARRFVTTTDDNIGYCDDRTKTIYIYFGVAKRQFRQTVLHEIAHALTPGDLDHGREWVNTAHRIGCTFRHLMPYVYAKMSKPQS